MSESENTDAAEPESKPENNPRKRIRHRKRQLYENILKQMEFYFSDANLSKDRFLGDLVKKDPFVPASEFLKFNKIRSMTEDVGDIVRSLKRSMLLELSEDKLKVRRKSPMMPYDADLRTVYVESIPESASREWLQRVFSAYGQVAYISLPKFKISQQIKGFAFIEFNKPQEAQKCLSVFTKMGCKLPSGMPPEDLSSIKMFSIDTVETSGDVTSDTKDEYEPPKKKAKKNKDKKTKSLDLKLDHESDSDKRLDTPTDENKSVVTTPSEDSKISDLEPKDGTSHVQAKVGAKRKKKLKKRSLKEKTKAKDKGGAPNAALWGLQVLHKTEWKALRNKYLNLQRKYMKAIKTNVQNKRHAYSGIPAPAAASMDVEHVNCARENESVKNVEPLEKIPGVFVKESLSEPCLDVRLTKRTIKSNIHVSHVDVKEGQTDVVIRFDSAKAADEYCGNSSNSARVLCGIEEEEQWRLAETARANKRTRGRTRLLHKAAHTQPPTLQPASPQPTHTHIRFEDE